MNLFTSNSKNLIPIEGIKIRSIYTLILVILFVFIWEMFWRYHGYTPSFSDNASLWAQRRNILADNPRAITSIGSSRILFGMDLKLMRDTLGQPVIQLASMKEAPLNFLIDLADDKTYKGFVIIGVSPGPFYHMPKNNSDLIKYYKNQNLSQKFSHHIDLVFERLFSFLDDDIKLFSLLDQIPWPLRQGEISKIQRTPKLANMTIERQAIMWDKLAQDSTYQEKIQSVWLPGLEAPRVAKSDAERDKIFDQITNQVNKIRAKGGEVIFVRYPSADRFAAWEQTFYPRQTYWDRLLTQTQSFGIHYQDHTQLNQFDLPDWSHLTKEGALAFTKTLATLIQPVYEQWVAKSKKQ